MATIATGTTITIAEMQRRETPDKRQADLIDIISETNAIIADAKWQMCNNGTFHQDTRIASRPSGSKRAYDQGVTPEAMVTETALEPTVMHAGISQVDTKKAQHSVMGVAGYRTQEDGAFAVGMTEVLANDIFDLNNTTDPRNFVGVNNRSDYNTLSSSYVYDNAGGAASATANKTSIYFFQWGDKMTTMIYPRNDTPGAMGSDTPIARKDFPERLITDANNSSAQYPGYETWFEIAYGLFIHDPRTIKRICNISTSNIDGVDDFSFDEDYMIDAVTDMEYNGRGAVGYCNRTVWAQMWKRANEKGNATFTQEGVEGPFAGRVLSFSNIPMKRVDQITNTQSEIS
jgi:hypothetical protein